METSILMANKRPDGTKKISLNDSSDKIIGKTIYDIYKEQKKGKKQATIKNIDKIRRSDK